MDIWANLGCFFFSCAMLQLYNITRAGSLGSKIKDRLKSDWLFDQILLESSTSIWAMTQQLGWLIFMIWFWAAFRSNHGGSKSDQNVPNYLINEKGLRSRVAIGLNSRTLVSTLKSLMLLSFLCLAYMLSSLLLSLISCRLAITTKTHVGSHLSTLLVCRPFVWACSLLFFLRLFIIS